MWKTICNRIIKEHIQKNDQDLIDLFKDMDRSMQKCFEDGKISNNSTYNIYLTNQNYLKFTFYEWYTLVDFCTGSNKICLISENNYHSHNYHRLKNLEDEIKKLNVRLGINVPKKLISCLKEVEPGELITFSSGASFACFDKQKQILTIKECCNLTNRDLNVFKIYDETEAYRLDADNIKSIYRFYEKISSQGPTDALRKCEVSTKPQQIINKYTNDLDDERLRALKFGPFKVRATRSPGKKQLLWYDDFGNKITALDVKIMIAWLNTTPIITDFIRKEESDNAADTVYDEKVKALLEQMYAQNRFKDIYNIISEYCKKQKGNLNITLKTYNASKKGFEAVGFSFLCENDTVKVFKLQYEENNINNDISNISPTSINDFEEVLKSKKENYRSFVKDKYKEKIKNTVSVQKADLIADIMAQNSITAGKEFDLLGDYNKRDSALLKSYMPESDKIQQFSKADDASQEVVKPQKFIMMCGLPGANKTEKAYREAEKLENAGMVEVESSVLYPVERALTDTFPIFDKNKILKSLKNQGEKNDNKFVMISLNDIRKELAEHKENSTSNYLGLIAEARITAAFARGYSVIYDAMNLDKKTRDSYIKIADKNDVQDKKIVVAKTNEKDLKKHLDKTFGHVPTGSVKAMLNRMEQPEKEEGWNEIIGTHTELEEDRELY